MINCIIGLLAGALAWGASLFVFDSPAAGFIPFLVVSILVFVLLNRRTAKRVNLIVARAGEILQGIQKLPSEAARVHMINKAVDILKEAYAYKRYQFALEANLNSQIGMIYYVQSRFKEAEPYLAHAFPQQGTAVAMYACLLYRREDIDGMRKAFDKALKYSKKEPLLYHVYAWCLLQKKMRDEAIRVLNECLTQNPNDSTTKENLDLLKNSGKIKMKSFNEQWYQFLLEKPVNQQLLAQFAQRPGFRNR